MRIFSMARVRFARAIILLAFFQSLFLVTAQAQAQTPTATLSLSPTSVLEDGTANMVYTVTLSSPAIQNTNVNFTVGGTAENVADFRFLGTFFIATGQTTSTTVTIDPVADLLIEPNETVVVTLIAGTGYQLSGSQTATGTIQNDDFAPVVTSITPASGPSSGGTRVTINGSRFTDATAAFVGGRSLTGFTVVNDTQITGTTGFGNPGPVNVQVSNRSGAGQLVNGYRYLNTAFISSSPLALAENSGASFAITITLERANPAAPTTVNLNFGGTATAGTDYSGRVASVVIPAGSTTASFQITPIGDTVIEPNETITIGIVDSADIAAASAIPISVTIQNDDFSLPSLTISDVVALEGNSGATPFVFTVSLSEPAPTGGVAMTVTTANGSATAGTDYTALSTSLTIPAGSRSAPVTVLVNGDTLNENGETFFVNATNVVGASVADGQGLGTISNDDAAPTISINDVSVTEGNAGTRTATFTVTLSSAALFPVTGAFRTADGTAVQPGDYTQNVGGFFITPGNLTTSFDIEVVGDTAVEPNETFFVNLSEVTGATVADGQGQGTITNDDDAAAPPTLTINDVTVTEGNAGTVNATFTITLSRVLGEQVTVNYAFADGTATNFIDFTGAPGTLTFNPGQTTQTIIVPVTGDTRIEANETYFIDLSGAVGATIADAQGLGTINNDDAAPTISVSDVTVTEGALGTTTPAIFTVSLSNASSQTVTAVMETGSNTATQNADYQGVSTTLTFNPGETSKTVTVLVNGDNSVEPNETFVLNVTNLTNATVADAQGLGTITNDDVAPLPTLSIGDVTVAEGNAGTTNATFTVTLSAASAEAVFVILDTANGTATFPDDYAATAGLTMAFAPGVTQRTFTVLLTGDTVFETNETFFLNLRNPTNATIADGQGLGTITNDDVAPLPTLTINDVTVTEGNAGSTNATFTVSLSAPADAGGVTFDIATANGTALAGSDFVAQALTGQTIAAGQTSRTFTVAVSGDTLVEPNENYFVNITNVTGAIVADGQGMGIITNDDVTIPTLTIDDVAVNEGDAGTTNVVFTVSLSAASGQTVTVNYATVDGLAIQPADYANTIGTVTFSPGQTSRSITVLVVGDTVVEPNETYFVNLSGATNATIADGQGLGTITNDDVAPLPTLSIADVTVTEGNTGLVNAVFAITLTAPAPAGGVRFDIATSNQLALAGTDYVARTLTNQTIAEGQTATTFTVQVIGDTLDEANERFFANISNLSGALPGALLAAATINDDDAPPSISVDDIAFAEGNDGTTEAVFTIRLSAPSGQAVTAQAALADGTAIAPVDYIPFTGVIFFAPGETVRRIGLPVNGDTLVEADENFSLNLSAPSNATIADAQGIATIINDDIPPTLSINDVSVQEGNAGIGNATFTVSLSAPAPAGGVTFDIATADGTALAGSDYSAQALTGQIIAEGASTRTFTVQILSDALNEPTESFFANVTNITGALVGDAQGQATITNDDPLPELTINDVAVVEGNSGSANAQFTVSLSAPSGQTVTVNYATADGSATSPDDYSATSGTVTFAPGQTSRTILVTVAGDPFFESNENFAVNLTGAVGAFLADGQGIGTITNDDVPVTITTAALNDGTAGISYNQTIAANGGTGPYRFAVTGGNLPAGLSLSPSGAISGTPTASGSFSVTITATDNTPLLGPLTATRTFTLVIGAPTIMLPATTLPLATRTIAYSAAPAPATGGTAPYSYAITGGALPSELTLNATSGAITGTPTGLGIADYTITATDSTTGTGPFAATQNYRITVVDIAPIATNSSFAVAYNAPAGLVPLNMSGGAALSLAIVTPPAHGTASVSGTTISYQPTAGYAGPDSFRYTATNSGGTSAAAEVSVTVGNPSFAVTAAGGLSATVALPYSQTFNFAGGTAPFTQHQISGLPVGLQITGTTASSVTIAGTPIQAGSFTLTVSARDSSTGTGPFVASQVFNLTVAAPVITLGPGTATLAAPYAAPYSQVFTATGGTGSYSYVLSGLLPTGFSFNNGTLSGSATTPGDFAIRVTATDTLATGVGAPFTVTRAYTISVAAPVIAITPTSLAAATAGQAYSANLSATGGVAPYSVALVGGSLPAGITLTPAGQLAGTPTVSGNFAITVQARDVNGQTGSANRTLQVGVPTLSITPPTLPPGKHGIAYSATLSASGGIAPYSFTIGSGALTSGLTLNPQTGLISGTPTNDGQASFTVIVRDSTGGTPATLTVPYVLSIAARPDPASDPQVTGLIQAQTNATRRFADAQMDNFIQRMESMHGEGSNLGEGNTGGTGIRFQNNVRLATTEFCRDTVTLMTNPVCANSARAAGIVKLNDWFVDDMASSKAANTGTTADGKAGASASNAGGSGGPWTIWTSGSVRFGERDAATGRVSQEFESEGLTLGADYRFSSSFGAGIGIGLGRETANIGDKGSESRGEAKTIAFYGSYALRKGIYLDWVGGYQSLDFDLRRYVTSTGALIDSQRSGDQWFGTLSLGGDIESGNWQVTPFGRLELTRAQLNGYTEKSGSAFDLAFLDQNIDFTSLVAGTRLKYRHATRWGILLPQARVEYQWNVERSADGRVAYADRLNNPFSVVPISGSGREELTFGARLEAILTSRAMSIALEYTGRLSSGGGSDHMFQIGLKHEF